MKLSLALAVLAVCCSMAVTQTAVKNPAVDASNAFACDLFKKLDGANAGKSVFFSPYSISAALAMTMEGAHGETALEMGNVLRLPATLRQDGPVQPWLTGPYSAGFNEFHRQLTSGADPEKAAAVRKQIAELTKELAEVNGQLAAQNKKGRFPINDGLSRQANKLADSINALTKQVDQFDLRVANGLWGDKSYPFKKNYLDTVDKLFGTGHLRLANFANNYPVERALINGWVEEQTNNRIKDLLPELPQLEAKDLRLVLVNAICFKGEWSLPFDPKNTKTENFLLADGGKSPAQMMHLTNKDARYAAFNGDGTFFSTPTALPRNDGDKVAKYPGDDGFLVAEMPIKGDKLSMVVIAPRKVDGLSAVEAKLTGENLAAWLGKLQKRTVQVSMPRFKLETDYQLGDLLQAMGMKKAFERGVADFTAMSTSTNPEDRLFISRVLHKAFVEVNEKGAEAAAATAVMMMRAGSAAPTTIPFTPDFRADRPFLFLIRDMDSGMVLFMGRMTHP